MRTIQVGLALALIAVASAHTRIASADDGLSSDQSPPPPRVTPTSSDAPPATSPAVWYGGDVLLVDLASDLLLVGAAFEGNGGGAVLGVAGAGGYLVGAPIVHATHHRSGGIVAGSVALRVGLPILGAIVGAAVATCSSDGTSSGTNDSIDLSGLGCALDAAVGAAVGFAAGMLTAQITDAAFLSTEPAHPTPSDARARTPIISVQPNVGMLRDSERHTVPTFGVTVAF